MIEIACKDLVFHFNKGHLQDPTIPMWVVKTKGKTYYVEHVEASIPWSTKETPDNEHTKGSIKFKHCLCTIDDDNCAILSPLTDEKKAELEALEKPPVRVMYMGYDYDLEQIFNKHEIPHSPVKIFEGSCTTKKQICDLLDKDHLSIVLLMVPELREVRENEMYWGMYERAAVGYNDEDGYDYDDDEDWEEEEEGLLA